MKVRDMWREGAEFEFQDADELEDWGLGYFTEQVHEEVELLADAIRKGEPAQGLASFLGLELTR